MEKAFLENVGTANDQVFRSTDGVTFTSYGTTGRGGAVMGDLIQKALNRFVRIIGRGKFGTQILQWNSNLNNMMSDLIAAMVAGNADALALGGGFNDANQDALTDRASHLVALRNFILQVRTGVNKPNLPVFFFTSQKSSASGNTPSKDVKFNELAAAEAAFINDANVFFAGHNYDLAQVSDWIHFTSAAYQTWGERGGRNAMAAINGTPLEKGPTVTGVASIPTTQTMVTIAHSSGTDFTPSSGITGFTVSSDGGTTKLTATGERVSATQIRLTHAALPGSASAQVYYLYGTNPARTVPPLDTKAAPLNPGFDPYAFTVAAGTGPVAPIEARINHGRPDAAAVAGWNTFTIPEEAASTPSANAGLSRALLDTAGAATGWTATIAAPFRGAGNTGATTGNNSGIAPDAVLSTLWYEGDSTQNNARRDPASIEFTGLKTAKLHTFRCVGSCSGTTPAYQATYAAAGINSKNGTHSNIGNSTLATTLTDIQPTADGKITLTVTAAGIATRGYLNETRIIEQV